MMNFLKILLVGTLVGWGGIGNAVEEGLLIPLKKVESFIEGYSSDELEWIDDDLENVEKILFRKAAPVSQDLEYIATAGGPGAGKSTILEIYIEKKPNLVYLDPDQRGLKLMAHTYGSGFNCLAVSRHSSFQDLARKQYTKWRRASNYITLSLLNKAFKEGYSIAHGTTLTSDEVESNLIKFKKKGYKITLLLCGSTDENRAAAVKHREQHHGFVQSTQKDFVEKGKMFFQKFPVYFQYADHIRLYWVDDFSHGAVEWGAWSPGEGLIIYDEDAQAKFVQAYENYRIKENPELPSFEILMKNRFSPH